MSRPMVDHVEQRGRHLDNIITRLGVDISVFRRAAHGATFELARWNCVRCAHPSACEEWIETLGRGAVIATSRAAKSFVHNLVRLWR
jgi:hypothetical protein